MLNIICGYFCRSVQRLATSDLNFGEVLLFRLSLYVFIRILDILKDRKGIL